MTVYRAAHRALVRDGFFNLRLRYLPAYAHDTVADEHTLIEFSPTVRLFYRVSDHKMVFDLDGVELTSSALEFPSGALLQIDLEHTATRRRIRVTGADVGNGTTVDVAGSAAVVKTILFVLGQSDETAEEEADLVELRPLDALTFKELGEKRILAQMDRDPDPQFVAFVEELAHEPALFHDTCLMIEASFNIAFAKGDLLDKIGSVVGLRREGWNDDTYRRYLYIYVDLLLSAKRDDGAWTGTAPNVIQMARRFVTDEAGGTVTYTRGDTYNFKLSLPVTPTIDEALLLLRFVRKAIYGGVLGYIQIPLSSDVWGSDSGPVTNDGIWGSASVVVAGAAIWDYVVTTI